MCGPTWQHLQTDLDEYPQRPVPEHKISDNSDSLWHQFALSMAYQKINLVGSCKLFNGQGRKEPLQLPCCHTLVDIGYIVKSIADQLMGLQGSLWSPHSDLQQIPFCFHMNLHAPNTVDNKGDLTPEVQSPCCLVGDIICI